MLQCANAGVLNINSYITGLLFVLLASAHEVTAFSLPPVDLYHCSNMSFRIAHQKACSNNQQYEHWFAYIYNDAHSISYSSLTYHYSSLQLLCKLLPYQLPYHAAYLSSFYSFSFL